MKRNYYRIEWENHGTNEFGLLFNEMNKMKNSLSHMISSVKNAVTPVKISSSSSKRFVISSANSLPSKVSFSVSDQRWISSNINGLDGQLRVNEKPSAKYFHQTAEYIEITREEIHYTHA